MWMYVVAAIVSLVALLLVVAAFKSKDLKLSRSRKMASPADTAFEQVNDLRQMNSWNPFLKPDPNARITFEGPAAGVGSICTWDGNQHVGAGKQTITECQSGKLVRMLLEFYRPFPGFNDVTFTFVPEGSGTVVTWSMSCQMAFVPRLVGIFVSMEKMIGAQFEKGLTDLQVIVEGKTSR